ncbi:MAG: hypothetical protein IPJ41_04815 [Phycisphaerales bacterium]|nr:hypothetical protein [Phycisphaerales bacterium]
MNNNVKVLIAVVALAAAGFLIVRSLGGKGDGVQSGRHVNYFICADPKCATEFEVEPGHSQAPPGSPSEVCPKCGKTYPTPAAKCPSCGRLAPLEGHGLVPATCPYCSKPMQPEKG